MATRYNYTGGIVTDGLVLHLDAAKRDSYPGSGTTWYDLSGNGNNGTLTNGPTYSGVAKDAAIEFDGTNQGCLASCSIDIREDFSLGLMYYYDEYESNSADGGPNINRQQALLTTKRYWQSDDSNKNGIWIGWGGQNTDDNDGPMLVSFQANSLLSDHRYRSITATNGVWSNLMITKIDSEIKIYRNGSYLNNILIDYTITTDSYLAGQLAIGGSSLIDSYTESNIPHVLAYNRALSADEISQNFNTLRGRYGI